MRIRAFTCFYNPGASYADQTLERLGELARQAGKEFSQAGYEVQSTRLATTPFSTLCPSGCLDSGVTLARNLEAKSKEQGFAYLRWARPCQTNSRAIRSSQKCWLQPRMP